LLPLGLEHLCKDTGILFLEIRPALAALSAVAISIAFSTPSASAAPGGTCAGGDDNASVNQYCESVPAVNGQAGVDDIGKSGEKRPGIPQSTKLALERSAVGRTLLRDAQIPPPSTDAGDVTVADVAKGPTSSHGRGAPTSRDAGRDPSQRRPNRAHPSSHPVPRLPSANADLSAVTILGGVPTGFTVFAAVLLLLTILTSVHIRRGHSRDATEA
jgi:hypothetical protein